MVHIHHFLKAMNILLLPIYVLYCVYDHCGTTILLWDIGMVDLEKIMKVQSQTKLG